MIERRGLARATISGVRWIALTRVIAETGALASSVALARLIPPEEFGRAVVALAVVALAVVLGPAGTTAHVVQRRAIDRAGLENAAFLTVAAALAATALTVGIAATAVDRLFDPDTARLLLLASPIWVLTGAGGLSHALLQRDLRFRRIALVDSTSATAGVLVAVGLAVAGLDGEALVAGALAAALTGSALALAAVPAVLPRPRRREAAGDGRFALTVTLSSAVYTLFRNVDYAILGARLAPNQVGYYFRGYQLGVEYQGKLSQIMLRVSFPVYSRAQDADVLRAFRRRIVRAHATAILPLLAGFAVVAPDLVPLVFGEEWRPAVRPAQIMCAAGAAYAVATGTGPLMVAIGRPGALLRWSVVELLAYAALVLVLAPHGIVVVAAGVAAFAVASLAVVQLALLRPALGISAREVLLDVRPGALAGAAALAAGGIARWLSGPDLAPLPRLAIVGTAATVAGLVTLRGAFPAQWADLAAVARRTRRRP